MVRLKKELVFISLVGIGFAGAAEGSLPDAVGSMERAFLQTMLDWREQYISELTRHYNDVSGRRKSAVDRWSQFLEKWKQLYEKIEQQLAKCQEEIALLEEENALLTEVLLHKEADLEHQRYHARAHSVSLCAMFFDTMDQLRRAAKREQREIVLLTSQLTQAKREIERQQAQLERLEQENHRLRGETSKLDRFNVLESGLATASSMAQRTLQALTTLLAQVDRQINELNTTRDSHRSQLQGLLQPSLSPAASPSPVGPSSARSTPALHTMASQLYAHVGPELTVLTSGAVLVAQAWGAVRMRQEQRVKEEEKQSLQATIEQLDAAIRDQEGVRAALVRCMQHLTVQADPHE